MVRIYTDMIADLFHPGHVRFLMKARKLGDYLIVGIHSDQDCEYYKRTPVMTMQERCELVAGCRFVDEVIEQAPLQTDKEFIQKHKIDLVVHAHNPDEESKYSAMYAYPMGAGIFKRLDYSLGISTTDIIERILMRNKP